MSALTEDVVWVPVEEPLSEEEAYAFLAGELPVLTAAFVEAEHPRDDDGRFTEKAGGGDFADRMAAALKGEEAYQQVPIRIDNSPVDSDHRKALFAYSSGKGPELNAGLRQAGGELDDVVPRDAPAWPSWMPEKPGFSNPNDKRIYTDADAMRAEIEKIDATLTDSVSARDIVVYRGIGDLGAVLGRPVRADEDLAGIEYTDHGFTSTTTSEESRDFLAEIFQRDNRDSWKQSANIRMLVPAGTHMVGPARKINEVMLDRGLRYRIVADNGVDENGIRQLDMEVIP